MDQALSEHVEQYLRHLDTALLASPNTVSAYRNDLTQLCQYLLMSSTRPANVLSLPGVASESESWADVSRTRLVGFIVALKEKGYATTTVARKIAALKSFFHYLFTVGIVSVDPSESLDSPRVDKVVPRGLSTLEVTGLFDQSGGRSLPDDVRDNAMLRLLYSSGLRVSPLLERMAADGQKFGA